MWLTGKLSVISMLTPLCYLSQKEALERMSTTEPSETLSQVLTAETETRNLAHYH